MIIQSARIEELPSALFLTSKYYLQGYISNHWPTVNDYSYILFMEHRRYRYDLPDYIHKNKIQSITKLLNKETFPISKTILDSITKLSSYYIEFHENRPYVKQGRFELWQNLITFNNPLLILSNATLEYYKSHRSLLPILKHIFKYSVLPTTYNTFIDNLFESEGTSELHMHFNGTSESSLVWLDALRDPYVYSNDLKKSVSNPEVQELYRQVDINFNPEILEDVLLKAKHVREFLVAVTCFKNFQSNQFSVSQWSRFLQTNSLIPDLFECPFMYTIHPCESLTQTKNEIVNEAYMFIKILEYLKNTSSELIAKLFHFYILAQASFQQLLVQQQDQYGFDQFQKITMNEIRETIEKKYLKRFIQLETIYKKPLEYLEVRFAPKATYEKNLSLISNILKDYEEYCKREMKKKPTLAIVGHFIKRKDTIKVKDKMECLIPYRHYELRQNLQNQAYAFLQLIENYPDSRKYIKGLDAAANELHASPEVFAPIFRYIRRHYTDAVLHKFSIQEEDFSPIKDMNLYLTYHAGEDFVHLLSGIRMVYEAITFLDMPPKSRIGHATALGISPKRWRERIGFTLEIKQGEWLDNLIFCYSIISKAPQFISLTNHIEEEIYHYYTEIYDDPVPQKNILFLAYQMRKVDPAIIMKFKTQYEDLNPLNAIEYNWLNLLAEFSISKTNKDIIEKEFLKYHNPKYYENYDSLITIDLDSKWDDALFYIQQEVIEMLNKKEVAIETMPSSNLRISFYEHYKEHHMFNWFHPSQDINQKSKTPYLVLASDDPGIFANNLRAEFIHLYETALEHGATIQEIENWLLTLNNNAKRFRF